MGAYVLSTRGCEVGSELRTGSDRADMIHLADLH